jgi:Homeodomain
MAPISANHLFRSESSSSLGSSSSDERERLFNFNSSSNPTTTNTTPTAATKRSRKRFTGTQLTMLEQLFHRTSHPSREERESLARELDLYGPLVLFCFVLLI